MRRVLVVGAGITGLAAAHRVTELNDSLDGRDFEPLVLEASSRAGGTITTERHGEFLIEGGPETKVDRGSLAKVRGRCELVGRYRYWDEPQGPTLYVYDDVQDLVGRIVNPRSVRILD